MYIDLYERHLSKLYFTCESELLNVVPYFQEKRASDAQGGGEQIRSEQSKVERNKESKR